MQLTTKDLLYLTDEMSWELLAMKKCHHFARECQDRQIADQIDRIGQMHQRHFETILNQIQAAAGNVGANQAGTSLTQ